MTETPKKPMMPRKIRIVLFVSLALNLVVVGLVAGMIAKGGPSHAGYRDRDPVMPYTRAFNEEQRRDLRRALRGAYVARPQQEKSDLVDGYKQALAALRAAPFDVRKLEAVVAQQKAHATRRQGAGQAVLSQFLSAMTPQERAAYADRLEIEIDRMSERRERWHKD